MKHRIIAAAAAVTAAAAAIPAQAFALDEGFEKKNVTAYLYSMDKSEELECLFSRELPEVPYVSMEDFLDRIYTVDFTTASEGNIYTVTGNNMTVTVDADRDTVSIQGFDSNYDINTVPDEAEQENDGGHAFVVGDSDVDAGIKPDCELITYGEDGNPIYENYYDFDRIEKFLSEFYGTGPADDSSGAEESQPDESSCKEDSSPATGAAGLIPLCAVVTAAAAMLFTRRICKKQ